MSIKNFVRSYSGWFEKGDGLPRNVYRLHLGGVVAPVRGMTRRGYVEGLAWLGGIRINYIGGNVVRLSYR